MPYKGKKPKHKAQKSGGQTASQPSSGIIDRTLQNLKLEAGVPFIKLPKPKPSTALAALKLDAVPSTSIPNAHPKPGSRKRRQRRTVEEACHAAKPQRTPEDIAAKDRGWKYYDVYKQWDKEIADEWEEYGRRLGK